MVTTEEDADRSNVTVAELVRADLDGPGTPDGFQVEMEPLELGADDGG